MRVVPSCDLGSLAPSAGEPALYTWRWYHSVAGLGLWIVLILAMVVPKANRTPKVLLILVPLVFVFAGWSVFASLIGGTSSDRGMFDPVICTLAVGSATLWLLAHRLAPGAWYKSLPAAMGVALGVVLVGGLWLGFATSETIAAIVFIGIMTTATVLGYALAVRGYRSRRAWRFLVFQAAGNVVVCLVGVPAFALTLLLVITGGARGVNTFLSDAVIWGLITGAIVFLIALPFAILGLHCPFFRQRIEDLLGAVSSSPQT